MSGSNFLQIVTLYVNNVKRSYILYIINYIIYLDNIKSGIYKSRTRKGKNLIRLKTFPIGALIRFNPDPLDFDFRLSIC